MKKKLASLSMIALLLASIGTVGQMFASNNQAEASSFVKQRIIFSAGSDTASSSLNIAKKYLSADPGHIPGQGYWQNLERDFDNAVYNLAPNNERIMFAASLQSMKDGVSIGKQLGVRAIAYDAEKWQYTPVSEQNSPIESFNQAADIAHNNGFKFAYNPTMSIFKGPDVNYLKQDWTKADILIVPYGGLVVYPGFKQQVQNVVDHVKSVNPDIEIYIFVSLRYATPAQIIAAMDSVKAIVDGAAISHHADNGCAHCTDANLDEMLGGIASLSSVASTPSTSVAPPAVAPTPSPDVTPTPLTSVAPPAVAPTRSIPNDQQTLGGVQETSPSPGSYDLLLITTGLLSAVSVGFAMMLRKRVAKKEIEV